MANILQDMVIVGGWYVCADNLIEAATLVRKGYATVCDDYDGLQLIPTEKGVQCAVRKGLAVKSDYGNRTGHTYPPKDRNSNSLPHPPQEER